MNTVSLIPIIFLDGASVEAFHIFNPNDWQRATRGVIQSCATELAVLQYSAERIGTICLSAKNLCRPRFDDMSLQWQTSPWDLAKTVSYCQVPELHLLIEGFFAGLKSLLDLNAQLLSTEGVVGDPVHGFHRRNKVCGGKVLNALDSNAKHGKKRVATAIRELIKEHKELWIDNAIGSRDLLIHPSRGAQQLMFELQVKSRNGVLVYLGAAPPHVGTVAINEYAAARVDDIKRFSSSLLIKLLKAS